MQYKMVVRQTMFDFDLTKNGNLKLLSVHFLHGSIMKKQNDLLLVTLNETIQFFLDRATPLSGLTSEQFKFINAAARYFGYMRNQEQLPVWLWAGSLNLSGNSSKQVQGEHPCQPETVHS